jgi:Domain of unknown function (DUF397)
MREFRRSTFSNNGTCVEVAKLPDGGAAVRDSKDPASLVLTFTAQEWVAFVRGVKAGEFG